MLNEAPFQTLQKESGYVHVLEITHTLMVLKDILLSHAFFSVKNDT